MNRVFSNSRKLLSALLMLLASCWVNADSSVKITVLLSGESQLYYDAVDGIAEQLDSEEGLDYVIKTRSDLSNEENFLADEENSNYIIAVGSKAARYISRIKITVPVLNILVPKRSYQAIEKESDQTAQYSVIYLDQPAERILTLAKLILDKENINIGMLFGPTSNKEKSNYLSAANKLSINLVSRQGASSKESLDIIESLITATDGYVALYDRKILNRKTAKWLLYMANVHRKPVVAYSKSYVEAGAIAAVYTSPYDAGVSAADWLLDNIKSKRNKIWKIYPQNFTISINSKIATKLNISIGEAGVIEKKIKAIEASR